MDHHSTRVVQYGTTPATLTAISNYQTETDCHLWWLPYNLCLISTFFLFLIFTNMNILYFSSTISMLPPYPAKTSTMFVRQIVHYPPTNININQLATSVLWIKGKNPRSKLDRLMTQRFVTKPPTQLDGNLTKREEMLRVHKFHFRRAQDRMKQLANTHNVDRQFQVGD